MQVGDFIDAESRKDLLRFTTAGSVDDGKSTLIGRLLHDSRSVYEDQLAAVKNSSLNRSSGPIDFSLLTDGLKAEREQGITIDVAYRYFSTPRRKFIIADTPGHEQYTRNMATGASTAELAVVLVDARKGVLIQSKRHAYISSLLGIPEIVVAVNKMDLVDYSREVYERICDDFRAFARALPIRNITFIPLSALEGDNVVERSTRMPWYSGPALLEHLENAPAASGSAELPLRFPVQYVIRPSLDFRGYAGQVASGELRQGDPVVVLPSGRVSRVRRIVTYDGDLEVARAPIPVTVCLDDEIDVSRGNMLARPVSLPHASRRMEATVVWMSEEPLEVDRPYLLKHTTQTVPAAVTGILHRVDVNALTEEPARELRLNEIGRVALETHQPLFFDAYTSNRATGSFILIDPVSNLTAGAGMILEPERESDRASAKTAPSVDLHRSRLTPAERYARAGHYPAVIWLVARLEVAHAVERMLFDRGCLVHVIADDAESHMLPELAKFSSAAGLITICSVASEDGADRERARRLAGAERFLSFKPEDLPADDLAAARLVCRRLEEGGYIGADSAGFSGEGI